MWWVSLTLSFAIIERLAGVSKNCGVLQDRCAQQVFHVEPYGVLALLAIHSECLVILRLTPQSPLRSLVQTVQYYIMKLCSSLLPNPPIPEMMYMYMSNIVQIDYV